MFSCLSFRLSIERFFSLTQIPIYKMTKKYEKKKKQFFLLNTKANVKIAGGMLFRQIKKWASIWP